MDMVYCKNCGYQVDVRRDGWHELITDGDDAGLAVCNMLDDSPGVEPGAPLTLEQKLLHYNEPANYKDLGE